MDGRRRAGSVLLLFKWVSACVLEYCAAARGVPACARAISLRVSLL